MTTRPRLFLDASVWIAAAGSRTGASALVLSLCREGVAVALASQPVLSEAERNIRKKLGREALLRFYEDLAGADPEVLEPPAATELTAQRRIISAKDAHVIAAALKGRVETLLTLDRRHFLVPSVLQAGLPFQIMTPGQFLRRIVRRGD